MTDGLISLEGIRKQVDPHPHAPTCEGGEKLIDAFAARAELKSAIRSEIRNLRFEISPHVLLDTPFPDAPLSLADESRRRTGSCGRDGGHRRGADRWRFGARQPARHDTGPAGQHRLRVDGPTLL